MNMSQAPIHILYIDDNPLDRELVRDTLEKENTGFMLTGVANQQELETSLDQHRIDLVLSDFNVLGLSGARERDQKALRISEAKYRSLLETAPAAIVILNAAGRIEIANARIQTLFGYEASGLVGELISRLLPWPAAQTDMPAAAEYLFALQAKAQQVGVDLKGRHRTGTEFPVEISLSRTPTDEGELVMCFMTDITDRRRNEQQLMASLAEKEVLLREIHHRVKNNLQIISSLLDLQSSRIQDEQALLSLHESQNRVRSMALIHEMLYQAEGFTQIDYTAYINTPMQSAIRIFASRSKPIR
jgi:PAS domain S-box-containing protein